MKIITQKRQTAMRWRIWGKGGRSQKSQPRGTSVTENVMQEHIAPGERIFPLKGGREKKRPKERKNERKKKEN